MLLPRKFYIFLCLNSENKYDRVWTLSQLKLRREHPPVSRLVPSAFSRSARKKITRRGDEAMREVSRNGEHQTFCIVRAVKILKTVTRSAASAAA